MSTPILVTKLFHPPPGPRIIARSRLVERLNDGRDRSLTLVSAPAGFGKSTLVSAWVSQSGHPFAWLSLDAADGDPMRFLAYLVAAVHHAAPGAVPGLEEALHASPPPPTEAVLTDLVNGLAALPQLLTLVLDDYHLVESTPVDRMLTFLLDYRPPQLHLVILTREDPPLPLARLRARGQLAELRAADLRFTSDEATEFLNPGMGLDLSPEDVSALEDRTEGWIAGLQLAAISMRDRADTAAFIRSFTGTDRYIVDYLVDEVLQRQPDHVRTFLLQTSMLDRLCGPLCDAVTGREDGRALLESLERSNLFVIPIDDRRSWFRYHHLFADVLQAHAMQQPGQVAERHLRASRWFAEQGLLADAIRHALAGGEGARAAELVELAATETRRNRQEAMLLGWLRALPGDELRRRPVLSAVYAGTLLSNGASGDVEGLLADAERGLEAIAAGSASTGAPADTVVVDHDEFRRLPGSIAVYRAGHALVQGDVDGILHFARQALGLLTDDDRLYRGAAEALQGLACWMRGDLEAAYELYAAGMASLLDAGYVADTIGGTIALADIRITQGRLHDAMTVWREALRRATSQGPTVLRGTADLYVGMAEIFRERNDLVTALSHLQQSTALGAGAGFPQNPYRWHATMARIRVAQGDLDGALDLFAEAERRYVSDFYPNVHPLAAQKARVWIAQGRAADALTWAREQGLAVDDAPSYLREYEHLTLARALVARARQVRTGARADALPALLDRLLEAAKAGGRSGSVIEVLLVQALACEARGEMARALGALERAMSMAEPEGYVRIFVEEGAPMARLLAAAVARGVKPGYAESLLTAFPHESAPDDAVLEGATGPHPTLTALSEPLSPRELDVLRLIAEGRSNQEISERLYLALSTVKGHNRAIFGKLGVQRRTEAVARARAMGVI